jgi:hypothetical protein
MSHDFSDAWVVGQCAWRRGDAHEAGTVFTYRPGTMEAHLRREAIDALGSRPAGRGVPICHDHWLALYWLRRSA